MSSEDESVLAAEEHAADGGADTPLGGVLYEYSSEGSVLPPRFSQSSGSNGGSGSGSPWNRSGGGGSSPSTPSLQRQRSSTPRQPPLGFSGSRQGSGFSATTLDGLNLMDLERLLQLSCRSTPTREDHSAREITALSSLSAAPQTARESIGPTGPGEPQTPVAGFDFDYELAAVAEASLADGDVPPPWPPRPSSVAGASCTLTPSSSSSFIDGDHTGRGAGEGVMAFTAALRSSTRWLRDAAESELGGMPDSGEGQAVETESVEPFWHQDLEIEQRLRASQSSRGRRMVPGTSILTPTPRTPNRTPSMLTPRGGPPASGLGGGSGGGGGTLGPSTPPPAVATAFLARREDGSATPLQTVGNDDIEGMLDQLAQEMHSVHDILVRSTWLSMRGTSLAGQWLTEEEISRLPKVRFEGEQQSCTICLEAYKPGEVLNGLPCGHCFHVHCLTRWLQQSMACPLCRGQCASQQTTRSREALS